MAGSGPPPSADRASSNYFPARFFVFFVGLAVFFVAGFFAGAFAGFGLAAVLRFGSAAVFDFAMGFATAGVFFAGAGAGSAGLGAGSARGTASPLNIETMRGVSVLGLGKT